RRADNLQRLFGYLACHQSLHTFSSLVHRFPGTERTRLGGGRAAKRPSDAKDRKRAALSDDGSDSFTIAGRFLDQVAEELLHIVQFWIAVEQMREEAHARPDQPAAPRAPPLPG